MSITANLLGVRQILLAPSERRPMTKILPGSRILLASLAITMFTSGSSLYAKKGGNGKPKPPPPTPETPVTYEVTPVTLPGTRFYFNDHNESAAVVGFDSNADRGIVYLPSETSAYFLDELPSVDSTLIPGWRPRSALGINNNGAIVGNLIHSSTEQIAPFVMKGLVGGTRVMQKLDPFDTSAPASSLRETAMQINDDGDIVGLSRKEINGSIVNTLYLGNSNELTTPFQEVVLPNENWQIRGDEIFLSNRGVNGSAMLTASIHDGSGNRLMRMNFDGTGFELAPNYTDSSGTNLSWWGNSAGNDINDSGDVAGAAFATPAKKGKIKNNLFGAVWEGESGELVPAGTDDALQSDYDWALLNNDGDFLLDRAVPESWDTLWHETWSAENGPLLIPDLIASDPNRDLFSFGLELTDHRPNDWPSIIAWGNETIDGVDEPMILILDPVVPSLGTAFARAASVPAHAASVPEPSATLLTLMAFVSLCSVRSSRTR